MIRHARLRFTFLFLLASTPFYVLASPNAIETAPAQQGPTQVEFSTAQISKWTDLPMGTYRVPNSDVIISGHQKGGAAPMLLFGLIGMAVQNSVNAHNGKDAMAAAEQALTFSIDEEAKAKLQAAIAEPDYASIFTSEANTEHKYEITGSVVLSFANQREVLPYVVLRVKLLDKKGSKLWTTRYIASAGARKPLTGDGSWTVDNALRPQVSKLLDLAIRTMLKDIAHPYPRDEASLVTLHGFFPHVNKPLQVVGYKLAEENGRMLFLPKLSTTIVFAGINILDAASMTQKPTVKGDKPLKLLKPNDPSLPAQDIAAAEPVATASATQPAATVPATEPTTAVSEDAAEDAAEAPKAEAPKADGGN